MEFVVKYTDSLFIFTRLISRHLTNAPVNICCTSAIIKEIAASFVKFYIYEKAYTYTHRSTFPFGD